MKIIPIALSLILGLMLLSCSKEDDVHTLPATSFTIFVQSSDGTDLLNPGSTNNVTSDITIYEYDTAHSAKAEYNQQYNQFAINFARVQSQGTVTISLKIGDKVFSLYHDIVSHKKSIDGVEHEGYSKNDDSYVIII